jgi:hypothetical protein
VRGEDVRDGSAAEDSGAHRFDGERCGEDPLARAQDDRVDDKVAAPMRCAPALLTVSTTQLVESSERPAASQPVLPSSDATYPSSETDILRIGEAMRCFLSGMDDTSCSSRWLICRLWTTAKLIAYRINRRAARFLRLEACHGHEDGTTRQSRTRADAREGVYVTLRFGAKRSPSMRRKGIVLSEPHDQRFGGELVPATTGSPRSTWRHIAGEAPLLATAQTHKAQSVVVSPVCGSLTENLATHRSPTAPSVGSPCTFWNCRGNLDGWLAAGDLSECGSR